METRGVLVVGSLGSGKSSLINTITGGTNVIMSSKEGVTFQTTSFVAIHRQRRYILYETAGLSEKTISMRQAVKNLVFLLNTLQSGLNLLVFVKKQGKLLRNEEMNYTLFVEALAEYRLPVVLFVTHCEMLYSLDAWVNNPFNQLAFQRCKMRFVTQAGTCVVETSVTSGLDPLVRDAIDRLRVESYHRIWAIIDHYSISPSVILFREVSDKEMAMWRIWNQICGIFDMPFLKWGAKGSETFVEFCRRLAFNEEAANELSNVLHAEEGR